MKAELLDAGDDVTKVQQTLAALERDPQAIEEGALAVLSAAWDEPAETERVKSAIEHARGKLPVIELGLLAIVIMYGLYLQKTGSLKETETVVERTPDGGFRTTTRSNYFGVGKALGSVVSLFKPGERPDDV
jgi:hypothetical protein